MNMKPKSEAMASVHEAISDLYALGGVDKATMRHFDAMCLECSVPEYTPEAIRALRSRLNISQAVLASVLNASVHSVQKWEQGGKRPSGTAQKLLHLLDRKGLEAVL